MLKTLLKVLIVSKKTAKLLKNLAERCKLNISPKHRLVFVDVDDPQGFSLLLCISYGLSRAASVV